MVQALRVLFISIEFSYGTFSGNGVLAQSQARALADLGHHVMVICGKPAAEGASGSAPSPEDAKLQMRTVELPMWGKLDTESSWREFAAAGTNPDIVKQVSLFNPQVVVGVDWHSGLLHQNLRPFLKEDLGTAPPFVYLNYRVYSRGDDDDDRTMQRSERLAAGMSIATIVLSRADAKYIQENFTDELKGRKEQSPRVLLPSLRPDMMTMKTCTIPSEERPYLLCCVRLSPEKEPERFVGLVEELSARGTLQELNLTPYLIGVATTPYAEGLKARLRTAVPSSIIKETFVNASELASIASFTRVNFHPCLYDAYGMTIVEVASQGVPSVINAGGGVGASELLQGSEDESFQIDMESRGVKRVADDVEEILRDPARLSSVSEAALKKSRSWGTLENAQVLVRMILEAMGKHDLSPVPNQHTMQVDMTM